MPNDYVRILDLDEPAVGSSEARKLDYRVRELERMLSQGDGGANLRRGPVQGRSSKTDTIASLVAEGRFPMKTIADTLGVSRSNLADWFKGRSKPRRP